MTLLQYLLKTGVCTSMELLQFKKQDDAGYQTLMQYAREQAVIEGIEITAK